MPWIWSKHSSQTRESSIGASRVSKAVMGTLRGGLMKARLVVSRSVVERVEQAEQKMPPHLRQC